MAYNRISICNRYGTNVLKVFQDFLDLQHGYANSPRRCLRLRLRENKICILPLGYAKGGVIMQILNCLGATPQAMPQAFFQKFFKFSPRRCLRLRLRENKICILPLGYAKGGYAPGYASGIFSKIFPPALPQATLQGK
ncbi:hypothetical protein T03_4072 [Trichinella britovi]|uniref:Uncharacterized protein n=1 Tax=Trichinella britovi TaxID=45882 RepID=A0A0V1CGY1_TRIBR|nr:hypothetical protein T03_4072 [Trichinella britovi]